MEKCKNLNYLENNVTILSALSDENIEKIGLLAQELMKS